MVLINFLKNYHDKFKKLRYWVYLFVLLLVVVFLFNYFLLVLTPLSPLFTIILSSTITITLLILEVVDLGIKEIIKLSHLKLLDIKELYIIAFLIFFFFIAIFCGNFLHKNQEKSKCTL
jgi:hypothetical protein